MLLLLSLAYCCTGQQSMFDRYIDANTLVSGIEKDEAVTLSSKRITPKMFSHSVKQKCLANPQRIVLPEVGTGREGGAVVADTHVMRRLFMLTPCCGSGCITAKWSRLHNSKCKAWVPLLLASLPFLGQAVRAQPKSAATHSRLVRLACKLAQLLLQSRMHVVCMRCAG